MKKSNIILSCEHCDYKSNYRSNLVRHKANKHNIGVKWHNCNYKECGKKFKTSGVLKRHIKIVHMKIRSIKCDICQETFQTQSHLKRHKIYKHTTAIPKFKCSEPECNKEFKINDDLVRHIRNVHAKGDQIKCAICFISLSNKSHLTRHIRTVHNSSFEWIPCSHCKLKFQTNDELALHQQDHLSDETNICHCGSVFEKPSELRKHQYDIHDIGVQWNLCPEQECTHRFKSRTELDDHLKLVHKTNIYWKYCDVDGCAYKSKSTQSLNNHKSNIHDINVVWHNCPEQQCDKKFKTKQKLKRHMTDVHDVNVKWIHCTQPNCDFKTKRNYSLTTHLASIHDINVVWHKCSVEGCESQFKRKSHLNEHSKNVHDIGDKKCDFCLENHFTRNLHKDSQGTHKVCRKCYKKATGKSSRVETIWSNYIDQNLGIQGLVGSDKSLKSMGGCLKYRPDKLYIDKDYVELCECDERQHSGTHNYSCDEKRVTEIYGEEGISGKTMAVIRWNPDLYKPPEGKRKLRNERLAMMIELQKKLRSKPPAEKIHVYYMFYNKDNANITQNLPKTFIYTSDDIKNL